MYNDVFIGTSSSVTKLSTSSTGCSLLYISCATFNFKCIHLLPLCLLCKLFIIVSSYGSVTIKISPLPLVDTKLHCALYSQGAFDFYNSLYTVLLSKTLYSCYKVWTAYSIASSFPAFKLKSTRVQCPCCAWVSLSLACKGRECKYINCLFN